MTDTDPRKGTYRPGQLLRRQFLRAVGAGVTVAGLGAGTAAAASDAPYRGPFHATYDAKTVDPATVDRVTTGGSGGAGQGDERDRTVPVRAPDVSGTPRGTAGSAQQAIRSGDLVDSDFDGLGATDVRGVVPSDAQVAAGPDHLVQAINSRLAAYDKDGTKAFELTLDDWFQNVSPFIYEPPAGADYSTATFFEDYIIFDPRARFDADSGRFLVACVDYSLNTGYGGFLLSVSSTADPTDPWYNYRIPPLFPDGNGGTTKRAGLVDFPELGFDGEAIYLTENFFPSAYDQATMVALDKAAATSGATADANHFTDLRDPGGGVAFTVQPAAVEGATPGHFVNSVYFQGQTLTVWTLSDPLGDPTLTNDAVRVEPYQNPPTGAQQPGTEAKIDMGDDRIMRVSSDGSNLWTAHTIDDGRSRWYEIDPSGPSVVQSGSFKRDGRSTFYPAIDADGSGAAMVYNTTNPRADAGGYVDVEVAVRGSGDPTGELTRYQVVHEGEGPYDYVDTASGDPPGNPPVMRWGDYNGISRDPDGGGFWIVSQYASNPPGASSVPDYRADDYYDTRIAHVTLD